MSVTSGFFNATATTDANNNVTYDKEYDASQFAKYFALLVHNGVFADTPTCLKVMQNETASMGVIIKPGFGWINGYWVQNDTDIAIPIDAADTSLGRIDIVVAGLNLSTRAITLYLKKGVQASSPIVPTLQRDSLVYEIELAQIAIGANTINITDSLITDERLNDSVCGIVTGIVDKVNTTDLYNQIKSDLDGFKSVNEAAFTTWFNTMQDQLAGDVASNLQNQITSHVNNTSVHLSESDKSLISGAVQQIVMAGITLPKSAGSISLPNPLIDRSDISQRDYSDGSNANLLYPGVYELENVTSNNPFGSGVPYQLYVYPLYNVGNSLRFLQIAVSKASGEIRTRTISDTGSSEGWFPDYDDNSSNKHYLRLANGIMIQWGIVAATVTITQAYGSMFHNNDYVTLIKSFVGDVSCSVTIRTTGIVDAWGAYFDPSTNRINFTVVSPISVSGLGIQEIYIAIGRWK